MSISTPVSYTHLDVYKRQILDSVRGCFEAYQSQLQAGTLLKIASAIAILVASLVALSLIDSAKLSAALGAITVLFADLMASMAIFNKISGMASGVIRSTTAMLSLIHISQRGISRAS